MVAIFQLFLILVIFACKKGSSSQTDRQDVWIPNLRGLPIGRNGEIVAEFEVSGLKISDERIKALQKQKCTTLVSTIYLWPGGNW